MDFPELLTEVQHRSGVTDVTSRGAHYVSTAEKMLEKRLKVGAMEKTVTLMTDAEGVAALPADFLQLRTADEYNVRGSDLLTDKIDTPITLTYYAKLPPIKDAPNWLSEAEPELYLQAVLFQVYAANKQVEDATATLALVKAMTDDVVDADVRARMLARRIDLRRISV